MTGRAPRRQQSRGVAALEFALSLTFLVPLLWGRRLGYYFYVATNAEEAARAGVREAVRASGGATGPADSADLNGGGSVTRDRLPGTGCIGSAAYCSMNEPPLGMGGAAAPPPSSSTCFTTPVNPTWTITVQVSFYPATTFYKSLIPAARRRKSEVHRDPDQRLSPAGARTCWPRGALQSIIDRHVPPAPSEVPSSDDKRGATVACAIWALIVVAGVALALIRVMAIDLPWHLATARLAHETGHWPAVNTFSYTFPDYPVYQQYPAFQGVMWTILRAGGWAGLSARPRSDGCWRFCWSRAGRAAPAGRALPRAVDDRAVGAATPDGDAPDMFR